MAITKDGRKIFRNSMSSYNFQPGTLLLLKNFEQLTARGTHEGAVFLYDKVPVSFRGKWIMESKSYWIVLQTANEWFQISDGSKIGWTKDNFQFDVII